MKSVCASQAFQIYFRCIKRQLLVNEKTAQLQKRIITKVCFICRFCAEMITEFFSELQHIRSIVGIIFSSKQYSIIFSQETKVHRFKILPNRQADNTKTVSA